MLGEHQQLALSIGADPLLVESLQELRPLALDAKVLQSYGPLDELLQLNDLLAERCRIDGCDHGLHVVEDLLSVLIRQVVEIAWQTFADLLLPVGFRIGEYLLALVPHPLEASSSRVGARREPTLEHGHGEAQGSPAG